jgi:hypothetical protein
MSQVKRARSAAFTLAFETGLVDQLSERPVGARSAKPIAGGGNEEARC